MINDKYFNDNVERYFEINFNSNDAFLINVFFDRNVYKYYKIVTID